MEKNTYHFEKCCTCVFRNIVHSQSPCNMCGKENNYKFFKCIEGDTKGKTFLLKKYEK